ISRQRNPTRWYVKTSCICQPSVPKRRFSTPPHGVACEAGTLGTGGTLGCTGSSASCWVSSYEEIPQSRSLPQPNPSAPYPVRSLSEQPFSSSTICVILGGTKEEKPTH